MNREIKTSNFESTSFKVRCLTSQFDKMLVPNDFSIDGFIIIFQLDNKIDYKTKFQSIYMDLESSEEIIESKHNIFPPISWMSDHAMIQMDLDNYGLFCSLNAFGESVCSVIPTNIFELFTQNTWNKYIESESIQNEFDKIKQNFFSKYDSNVRKELKDLTRNFEIVGGVFTPPSLFKFETTNTTNKINKIHNILMNNYNKVYCDYKNKLDNMNLVEREKVSNAIMIILDFFDEF